MQTMHDQRPDKKKLTNDSECLVFARITSIDRIEAVQHKRLSVKEIIICHVDGYATLMICTVEPLNEADMGLTLKSYV